MPINIDTLGNGSRFSIGPQRQRGGIIQCQCKRTSLYSITLNAFFVVRWTDRRMLIDKDKMDLIADGPDAWIPVDVNFIKEFWLPDAEILNLKEFKTLDVLSKLEGLWLNRQVGLMD